MEGFLIHALLAGAVIALIAGPIGCVLVWKRMSYFGATLSHAALLGIAVSFLFDFDYRIGILVVGVLVSLALLWLQKLPHYSNDTLLGIMAHSALAAGLVVLSLLENVRVDLNAFLFGDILSVQSSDLYWIAACGIVCALVLKVNWQSLIAFIAHPDLARVEGIATQRLELYFLLILTLLVAVAMQIVGVLLIVSLLIIPPAVARPLSKTPEQMAVLASVVGLISIALGLAESWQWDLPAGPAIVLSASALFVLSLFFSPHKS